MTTDLTHLDDTGRARMVNVLDKPDTKRTAIARGEVKMQPETLDLIREGNLRKGDVFSVAEISGVMAAKRTSELIPLCHQLPLSHVDMELVLDVDIPGVIITAKAQTIGKTGVEMEALTAVTVAALTVYDMVKAVDKSMVIQNIHLLEKRGGQSGDVINE